jgi:hypothetical protein
MLVSYDKLLNFILTIVIIRTNIIGSLDNLSRGHVASHRYYFGDEYDDSVFVDDDDGYDDSVDVDDDEDNDDYDR